jgi:thiol-disulfide isomerase/thioredoxin
MDKKIIVGIIVGIVIIGGLYMVTRSNEDDKMMEKKMEDEKMMKKDVMEKDEAMKASDDAMMKKDEVMAKPEGEVMMKDDKMMEKDSAMMMKGGQYTTYDASKLAFAKEGKVVLFFNASWCPQCQAIDKDIKASLSDIPKDTLILSVDYDTNKDLKTKYGVTTQHTFVQVDANGSSLTKWVGGNTLEEVISRLK